MTTIAVEMLKAGLVEAVICVQRCFSVFDVAIRSFFYNRFLEFILTSFLEFILTSCASVFWFPVAFFVASVILTIDFPPDLY